MPNTDRAAVAAAVRAELARRGKTQREVGEILGLPQPSISVRLRGLRSFRAEELISIADWLGIPVVQLMPDTERVA
jgi:transcriptional regulator with XRE-family HTH domain